MNHEIGPQEAKAIGAGTQTQPTFTQTAPSKRRLRWKLLTGALALVLAGYGLADAAHSFGWWPPLVAENDPPPFTDWGFEEMIAAEAACEATLDVDSVLHDYDGALAVDAGDALDDSDWEEAGRIAVKRVATIEALLEIGPTVHRFCEHRDTGDVAFNWTRSDREDRLAALLEACDTLGLHC